MGVTLSETDLGALQPPAPEQSADALFAGVYARLKAMAHRQRLSAGGATLNTTALVHELYMKLSTSGELVFADPAQFFDYAAQAMRHILIDRARARMRFKRGSDMVVDGEDAAMQVADQTAERLLELDDALRRLERESARAARLVALHYFAGLSFAEIAALVGVTTRTLNYDWRFARAFLYKLLD
jgi:RNA polymerase sigma factor (TIGR02999 family)